MIDGSDDVAQITQGSKKAKGGRKSKSQPKTLKTILKNPKAAENDPENDEDPSELAQEQKKVKICTDRSEEHVMDERRNDDGIEIER